MKSIRRLGRGAPAPPPPAPAQPPVSPYPGLAELLPDGERRLAARPPFLKRLRTSVHPRFYLAQLAQLDADAAAVLGEDLSVETVLEHYIAGGARTGLRPSALFHPAWYAEQAAGRGLDIGEAIPFLHWLSIGWREEIVPTPVFDPEFYVAQNKPARNRQGWIFEHYLDVGCRLPRFIASRYGAPHSGARSDDPTFVDPLMLPELLVHSEDYDLRATSWLEEGVLAAMRQHDRLTSSPVLREIFAKAAIDEPLVGFPKWEVRPVTSALHRNSRLRLPVEVDRAELAIRHLVGGPIDTVILVPHCRMGGAARVSGIFAHAVQEVGRHERALIVATDLPAFERPDWFPDDVPVFDLASYLAQMRDGLREDALLDLVRRLAPRRIVNINSRLGWRLLTRHGANLASIAKLGAYLFTWEINELGYRGGYPIREFQQAFAHLDWTLFDSAELRDEMITRYAMPAAAAERLVLARTPVDAPAVDVAGVFEQRRTAGLPLRAFWAGRFDRQKRFDLVVEIARRMPELEIWAWGKAVMGTAAVDFDDLPANIRLMGTYTDFAELPLAELDFMLYTSQWDGIPTLLLDGAQSGLPVVASAVGGVPEVITEDTGYPVTDLLDAGAYVAAIEELVADPASATKRVVAVRELIARDFSLPEYQRIVATALEVGGPDE
ncbi:glycosyltransferase family 4 protein [Nocardioides montaniterrae]